MAAAQGSSGLADEAARLAEAAEGWAAARGLTLDAVLRATELTLVGVLGSVSAAWRDVGTAPDGDAPR